MRRTTGTSPPQGLLRLRERAADYAWAAARQVQHVLRPSRPLPDGPGGRAPVVLLPGVYEPWPFLAPLARALAATGHPVHVVPGLGYNRRPVLEGAELAASFLDTARLEGTVLVAHSKGGLVGKQVMLSPSGRRVAGMVAVATPFRGSRWARYLLGQTLRAFSPADPVLLALAAERAVDARITAVYPRFDPHIPETGYLEGATNVELPLSGHFKPLGDPSLVEVVVREAGRLAGTVARQGDDPGFAAPR
ncbi:alpha/beta hydrolase [Cellulosimicrobium sp. CUA-896]|uniref:alpha/beta hydrolase n=1 Tax=Cellulosimicrobium sp. CUA-896 TaxID=1517881 RepID=UPI000960E193|nr:alpha/beta hydrolase [Cellulosimicrobium sp. CUA-896]OLT55235.1 alpha/beta hydrolase [Cellulosimicrobium sp. CUA-896]